LLLFFFLLLLLHRARAHPRLSLRRLLSHRRARSDRSPRAVPTLATPAGAHHFGRHHRVRRSPPQPAAVAERQARRPRRPPQQRLQARWLRLVGDTPPAGSRRWLDQG
jgi:hypothetical protein